MKKDIKWGSIEIKGMEDGDFNKFSIKQLTAIENAAIATKLNIESGHYQKYSKSALGTKRTEEQSLKLSENRKGRKLSDEARKNISIGAKNRKEPSKLKGKKRTEEEKKKMSENRMGKGLGRIITDGHREKLKEALKTKFVCEFCNREIGGKANYLKHLKNKHNHNNLV